MRNLFKSLLPILLIISMIVTMGVESLSIDNPIPEDGANQEKIPIQTIGEDIKEEEPKAEEPKVGSPKVDKPKEELPKLDKPIEQAPKAEEPKAEGPNKEELKVEAPKVEEPEAEPPKVDEIEKEKAVNLTSKVNGVTVVISAEPGVLPNDTILDVKALSDKDSKNYSEAIMEKTGTSLDNFKLFDITLLDNEKNEIQPKGNVEVSFSGVDFIKDSEEIVVYHLESNTAKKGIGLNQLNVDIKADEMKIETNNDKVTFNTDHFSIYGVGDKATATYNFKVDSAEVDQQIVLNGEYLKEPQTPAKQAAKRFTGWYLEGSNTKINFNDAITVAQDTSQTYTVNARFENVYYVYFVYNGDVIKTKEVAPNTYTNDDDVPIVVTEAGKVLNYWSDVSPTGAEFVFNTNPINSDKRLYAVLADRWKVTFDAQGGSPLLPKYIENNNPLGTVVAPVRAGYSFQGWYLTANGTGTQYTATAPSITGDIKLYAKWQAKTDTKYTVLNWQENPNDDGYTLVSVVPRTGTTGQPATYATINYTGFTLNTTKTNETNVIIKGDETSVKSVYYKRNTWTLKFRNYKDTSTLKEFGTTKIKQGADTSFWWNQAVTQYPSYSWYTTKNGNTSYTLAPDMPNKDLTVYGQPSSGTDYTIYYFEDGTNNYVHPPFKFSYNGELTLTQEDYVAFPGFTVKSKPTDGSQTRIRIDNSNYKWELKYTRNSYNITFQKNNQTGSTTTPQILYEGDISNRALAGFTVDVTTRDSDGFIFKGWYDNSATEGVPYNFTGKKMPAGNLILYAKWAPPTYTVKYYETQDGDGILKSIAHIPARDTIAESQLTKQTVAGVPFIGWYWYLNGVFLPYDFNTPVINNDYVLYPVWGIKTYKVSYDAGAGSGTVVAPDLNDYYLGAAANVSEPTGLTPPTGKVFIGWKKDADPLSKVYYPNDKLTITGDMILTAQWGDLVEDTILTYYKNDGTSASQATGEIKNNGKHDVLTNMFERPGYQFMGWNTKADGTGQMFQPGAEIIVSNVNEPNELYAQWVQKLSIDVNKVWVGKALDSVTINLMQGQGKGKVLVDTKVLSKDETDPNKNWKDTFTNLDKTDAQGNDYVYTIEEVIDAGEVENYTSVITGNISNGFTVTNTQIVGSLEIIKKDGKTGEVITTGAEFELQDLDGNVIGQSIITGTNGKYKFEDLPFGSYKLVEIKAPTYLDGNDEVKPYNLLATPIDIVIDGDIVTTVDNYKSGWLLPATGGKGTLMFYGLGTLFILLAGILLMSRKERNITLKHL